jgi:hypothetical protein
MSDIAYSLDSWWSPMCWDSCLSERRVVSRGVYSRYIYTLRMLCTMFSFPQSERETLLLVGFATRPPRVFARPLRAVALGLPLPRLPVSFTARPPYAFALALPSPLPPFDFAFRHLHVAAGVLLAHVLLGVANSVNRGTGTRRKLDEACAIGSPK